MILKQNFNAVVSALPNSITLYVYPTALGQQAVIILSNDPAEVLVQIFNAAGLKVYEKILNDVTNTISAERLNTGFYMLRLLKKIRCRLW